MIKYIKDHIKEKGRWYVFFYWIFAGITALIILVLKRNEHLTGYANIDDSRMIFKSGAVIVAMIVSLLILNHLYNILSDCFLNKESIYRKRIKYSIPYLIVVVGWWFARVSLYGSAILPGDEMLIYNSAFQLYPFNFGLTSQIYIICFFLLPIGIAPVIVKTIFESYVVGYFIEQTNKHSSTGGGYFCM